MGYRTNIKNINSIGHLIEGNAYTFFQQTISSREMFQTNMMLLEKLLERTSEELYMSYQYWNIIEKDLIRIRREWDVVRRDMYRLQEWSSDFDFFGEQNDDSIRWKVLDSKRVLDLLNRISHIFSRCAIKSILLPGFDGNNPMNRLLTEESLLKRLIEIHPGDTALILQFEERFDAEDKSILNVFPKFEKALHQMDNWPGVFLWDAEDSLFIPVQNEDDIYEMFYILRYERNSFSRLRDMSIRKMKKKNYAYIFHLSDLHFGNKVAEKRALRMAKILEVELGKLEDRAVVLPVITGDIMQSPVVRSKNAYLNFKELLISKGFAEPIHVLGNHDVDTSGILKMLTVQKSVIAALSKDSRITVLDELKMAFIRFDSNAGGQLAQGMIGEDQLMEIGNEIDTLKRDGYTFLALLHHHPLEIENPEWYSREWYEALLGTKKFEKTMKLVDSELFLEWIGNRGIKYVLHGHKHIPKVQEYQDITVIAAGSMSGSVKHVEMGKTYISYNLIKYDVDKGKPVSCSIIAEEVLGSGTKNILVHLFD